jgi:hypothetical protein
MTTCDLCAAGLPHPLATHCPRCHASWTRTTNTAHCPTCHRTFSTPGVFDRHLLRDGCQNPADVHTRKGVPVYGDARPNKRGTDVWRLAGPPDNETET